MHSDHRTIEAFCGHDSLPRRTFHEKSELSYHTVIGHQSLLGRCVFIVLGLILLLQYGDLRAPALSFAE